jgi:hypothetical protein
MAKRYGKDAKNIEEWLINLRRDIGTDIVVNLLVSKREGVNFVGCIVKDQYFNESDDDDSETPNVDLSKFSKTNKVSFKDYIG